MKLSIMVTSYVERNYYRALIVDGAAKILGKATCKNCPRVAANAAVAKTYGLPAAATITPLENHLAWRRPAFAPHVSKLRAMHINFYYEFTFNPADHEIKKP